LKKLLFFAFSFYTSTIMGGCIGNYPRPLSDMDMEEKLSPLENFENKVDEVGIFKDLDTDWDNSEIKTISRLIKGSQFLMDLHRSENKSTIKELQSIQQTLTAVIENIQSGKNKFLADVDLYMSRSQDQVDRLRDMELFVLDNSIRETTVGSLKAHTVANKRAIYEEVKKAGIKYFVIESFTTDTRIGEVFLEELIQEKEDLSNAFAFADLFDQIVDKVPQPGNSIGLKKCIRFGIHNVILEFDLVYYKIDFERFDMVAFCKHLKDKIDWIRSNISKDSMIFVNFRDFSDCMTKHPERVGYVVNFLSSLPPEERITGIIYEDLGKILGVHLSAWTRAVRNEMLRCGWQDGYLLFHVHEEWGMAQSVNLDCLAAGANGIWAALCTEGAGLGHADSTTTILNMIRLGNTAVLKQYNCKYLRDAAINVTKLTTGSLPHPKQPIYGERAIDMVFGFLFASMKAQPDEWHGFDMCEFLGIKRQVRISTIASAELIYIKLNEVFGEDPQFTMEMCENMRQQILKNAADNRKEEYNSDAGLAMLFDQAGGHTTQAMTEIIEQSEETMPHIENLIKEIKQQWYIWGERDGTRDDELSFDRFYAGFMAPYFGCYRCEDSQKGLRALDMDNDGLIDW